jgi:large subunit ribosomal protein L9e
MKAVYAHFPININTGDGGSSVEIRNFLGEKYTRTVNMLDGVVCQHTGVKDEIEVMGNDIEKVSLSGMMDFSLLRCLL